MPCPVSSRYPTPRRVPLSCIEAAGGGARTPIGGTGAGGARTPTGGTGAGARADIELTQARGRRARRPRAPNSRAFCYRRRYGRAGARAHASSRASARDRFRADHRACARRSRRMPKPALWNEHPPVSAMQVVCDVHDVLFDWFLKASPRHLCLHGAAVRIGGGLVCFPSVQKTGKSTLCVALAARGHTVYGDDVLAIEPEESRGVALASCRGCASRCRRVSARGSFGS